MNVIHKVGGERAPSGKPSEPSRSPVPPGRTMDFFRELAHSKRAPSGEIRS